MNVKKVGSIIAGTVVIGAALSAPVMAGMDNTGIAKGFFYDANYNPVVQIVVGEKGMATDAVAAGNIAATIGNLAYMTKTVTAGGTSYTPEGQVVITTAARGAVGDYVQDTNVASQDAADFYDTDVGFTFGDAGSKTYEKGDFTSYTLSCDKQSRNEAGVLMTGSYKNIHCLFCHNLCMESLENPAHDMKEQITIDSTKITYYEDGLGDDKSESLKMAIGKNAVSYVVKTDFIPLTKLIDQESTSDTDKYIDFEYRGKMLLFGEEYYVKDVDGSKIYLDKGKVLDDVTSEGFTSEYKGYKFKVDHLIYAAEYQVAGILLDVQKPDGTIVQTQISKMANGVVDDLELAGVYAEEAAALQSASIIVYDLASQVVLEDGEDLQMGGKTYTDWEVKFTYADFCEDDSDCDLTEYDNMQTDKTDVLLKNVNITYTHALDGDEAIEKDESLSFPNKFKLTFKGYLDNDYSEVAASGAGQGNIKLEKGDDAYQLIVSFTGDDGNRYNKVRLDEGPFKRNDLFMAGGAIYKFDSYTADKKDAGSGDDLITVKLKPEIRGTMKEISNMQRYCSDDANAADSYTGLACGADIDIRKLAITDAMKDDDATEYENDDDLTLATDKLYIKEDVSFGLNTFDVVFDDNDKSIMMFDDFGTDVTLAVNGDLVGTFDDFMVDGYNTELSVTTTDTGVANYEGYKSVVNFAVADGMVVADMYNRAYNEDVQTSFDTSLKFYNSDTTFDATTLVETLDDDTDTLLIVPEGGDKFTIDWGSDNRFDALEIAHPQKEVDSTYFLGTTEEETVSESTITKADEGKEITAGCCSFTVSKFDVNVGNATSASVMTSTVSPIVGSMVVPETAADATKNLIIVGGPAVNAMTTVSKDDISAAADKFIVKKDGNKILVAGWTADDTIAAGNSLIAWLKANAH